MAKIRAKNHSLIERVDKFLDINLSQTSKNSQSLKCQIHKNHDCVPTCSHPENSEATIITKPTFALFQNSQPVSNFARAIVAEIRNRKYLFTRGYFNVIHEYSDLHSGQTFPKADKNLRFLSRCSRLSRNVFRSD